MRHWKYICFAICTLSLTFLIRSLCWPVYPTSTIFSNLSFADVCHVCLFLHFTFNTKRFCYCKLLYWCSYNCCYCTFFTKRAETNAHMKDRVHSFVSPSVRFFVYLHVWTHEALDGFWRHLLWKFHKYKPPKSDTFYSFTFLIDNEQDAK
jgi:hypothetical protein